MEIKEHFVAFDIYCRQCVYRAQDSIDEPCNACLTLPAREGTRVPSEFKMDSTITEADLNAKMVNKNR